MDAWMDLHWAGHKLHLQWQFPSDSYRFLAAACSPCAPCSLWQEHTFQHRTEVRWRCLSRACTALLELYEVISEQNLRKNLARSWCCCLSAYLSYDVEIILLIVWEDGEELGQGRVEIGGNLTLIGWEPQCTVSETESCAHLHVRNIDSATFLPPRYKL